MREKKLLGQIEALKEQIRSQNEYIEVQNRKLKSYEQYISENQAMHSEQIVAEQIQKSMLPTEYPAFEEYSQIDLYADMDTACVVGGDFYDYFPLDGGRICFGISDVEGKGIPAAMYMAVTKTMIKLRLQGGESLADVFAGVNRLLCTGSMKKRFVTSWMAVYHVETGKMTCINAGHNYPLLRKKDGSIQVLKEKSGLPLASYYSRKLPGTYREFELSLEKDDVLLLYTDGVTEAQNSEGELFGLERLSEALGLYMSDPHSMKELTAYIRRRVIAFSNHAVQDDDITILALSIKG